MGTIKSSKRTRFAIAFASIGIWISYPGNAKAELESDFSDLAISSLSEETFDDSAQEESQLDESVSIESISQPNPHISYVPMPSPSKPRAVSLAMQGKDGLQGTLRNVGSTMKEFIERMSRGKVKMSVSVGPVNKGAGKGPNNLRLVLVPGAGSHVPIIGNAITAKHELGHEIGLGHASTRIWGTQNSVKQSSHEHDPYDPMTISPGVVSLNAAHIHYLGWFTDTEEAYAEDGGEYVLRLINDGNRDYDSLKALYYQVPGTTRSYWFSYVQVRGGWKAPAGMPGTAIAIHSASGGSTFLEGQIGLDSKVNIRTGLILELSEATSKTVKVKVTKDPNWVLDTGTKLP